MSAFVNESASVPSPRPVPWPPRGVHLMEAAIDARSEAVWTRLVLAELDAYPTENPALDPDRVGADPIPWVEHDSVPRGRSRILRLGHDQQGRHLGPLPTWIEPMLSLLGCVYSFDSVAICEYPPGHGIGAHADAPVYRDLVAVLSIGDGCVLRLRPRDARTERQREKVFDVTIARGSLYFLTDDAYLRCTHEIRSLDEDRVRHAIVLRSTKGLRAAPRALRPLKPLEVSTPRPPRDTISSMESSRSSTVERRPYAPPAVVRELSVPPEVGRAVSGLMLMTEPAPTPAAESAPPTPPTPHTSTVRNATREGER